LEFAQIVGILVSLAGMFSFCSNENRTKRFEEAFMGMPVNNSSLTGAEAIGSTLIDIDRRRGRGAASNASGRFESLTRFVDDDGWNSIEELAPFRTEVQDEQARKIITFNESPDISFDRSINPYRGCEHGCVYCFARPTHAHMGLSAGLDFETKLYAKPDAAVLLEKELAARNYQPRTIAMGTNTDPYQPIERQRRITRSILEVLDRTSHPLGIVTKSALITRDVDILARILDAAHAAGAREAGYVMLRLPREVSGLMREWLAEHRPDALNHVFSLMRSARDGKDYDSRWGLRMSGTGPYAWTIGRRFELAANRLGLNERRLKLRTDLFTRPTRTGEQLALF
jgi:DNA repair photolyase